MTERGYSAPVLSGSHISCNHIRSDNTPGMLIRQELIKSGVQSWNDLNSKRQVEIMRQVCRPFSSALMPTSKNIERWDVLVMMLLIFTSIVTPFEVAFLKSTVGPLFFVNCTIDLCFWIDMRMQFFMAFRDELGKHGRGSWVTDLKLIRARYIKTWFFIDLTSLMPFDGIGHILNATTMNSSSAFANMRALRLVRMARLLKLARLFKCSRIFENLLSRVEVKYARIHLVSWGFNLLFLAHLSACLMAMVGLFSEDENGYSWISAVQGSKGVPVDQNVWTIYNMAVYWALMTITSIGYGDITPQSNLEYVVVTCLMLVGSGLWAHILGSFCAIISNLERERMAHEQRMDACLVMAQDRLLPTDLRMRLRRFFQQSRRMHRMSTHSQVTALMSPALRGEVALHVTLKYLRRISFLRTAEPEFVSQVAKALQLHFFPPREKIVPETTHGHADHASVEERAQGTTTYADKYGRGKISLPKETYEPEEDDEGEEWACSYLVTPPMTILERGIASRYGILSAGSVWHEDTITVSLPSLRDAKTATSLTFVSVYTLTRDDFFHTLRRGSYPVATNSLRRMCMQRSLLRMLQRAAEEAKKMGNNNVQLSAVVSKLLDKMSTEHLSNAETQPLEVRKTVSENLAGSLGRALEVNVGHEPQKLAMSGDVVVNDAIHGLQEQLSSIKEELSIARREREDIRKLLVQVLASCSSNPEKNDTKKSSTQSEERCGANDPHTHTAPHHYLKPLEHSGDIHSDAVSI